MKKTLNIMIPLIMAALAMVAAIAMSETVHAEPANVKNAVNKTTDGAPAINVTWTKNDEAAGYRVLRKTGDGDYEAVFETDDDNAVVSYLDKDVTNGTKYTYKVESIYVSGAPAEETAEKSVFCLKKPTMSNLVRHGDGFKVSSAKNAAVTGFQIYYARKSSFASKKTVKVVYDRLDAHRVGSLLLKKKYFVKVRSYKTGDGITTYSEFSPVKNVTTQNFRIGYIKDPYYFVHVGSKKSKKMMTISYKTEVKVYGGKLKRAKSQYFKMNIKGKTCYRYIKKNTTPFMAKGIVYSDYKKASNGAIQQAMIDLALNIHRNKKTKYAHVTEGSGKHYGYVKDGKMQFDCSGFGWYLLCDENVGVISKYLPKFYMSYNITKFHTTGLMYTDANGQHKATQVCKGKPDYSKMKPGDFVYFDEDGKNGVDHVGMYLGNKEFIHAATQMDGVIISPLKKKYLNCFVDVRRLAPTKAPEFGTTEKTVNQFTKIYNNVALKDTGKDSYGNANKAILTAAEAKGSVVRVLYTLPPVKVQKPVCYVEVQGATSVVRGFIKAEALS
jgi:hypothetical protein